MIPDILTSTLSDPELIFTDDFNWDSFLNHTVNASLPQAGGQRQSGDFLPTDASDSATAWTDMFVGDANIDWIGLGDTLSI